VGFPGGWATNSILRDELELAWVRTALEYSPDS
jgi:hypothetical protein